MRAGGAWCEVRRCVVRCQVLQCRRAASLCTKHLAPSHPSTAPTHPDPRTCAPTDDELFRFPVFRAPPAPLCACRFCRAGRSRSGVSDSPMREVAARRAGLSGLGAAEQFRGRIDDGDRSSIIDRFRIARHRGSIVTVPSIVHGSDERACAASAVRRLAWTATCPDPGTRAGRRVDRARCAPARRADSALSRSSRPPKP